MPKLTIEEIVQIRNALQVIQRDAKAIPYSHSSSRSVIMIDIIKQAERIDKLLPKLKKEKKD